MSPNFVCTTTLGSSALTSFVSVAVNSTVPDASFVSVALKLTVVVSIESSTVSSFESFTNVNCS